MQTELKRASLNRSAAERRRVSVFNLAVALWNCLFRPSVRPCEDNPSNVLLAALIALAGAPAGLLLRSRQLGIDAHARYLCNG